MIACFRLVSACRPIGYASSEFDSIKTLHHTASARPKANGTLSEHIDVKQKMHRPPEWMQGRCTVYLWKAINIAALIALAVELPTHNWQLRLVRWPAITAMHQ